MTYDEFLTRVIEDGIVAAHKDYKGHKLEGALAGFAACRGKTPEELGRILVIARDAVQVLYGSELRAYWKAVCYMGEVEWVCNCVSAMLVNNGQPTIITPTAMGTMNAARIIGIAA